MREWVGLGIELFGSWRKDKWSSRFPHSILLCWTLSESWVLERLLNRVSLGDSGIGEWGTLVSLHMRINWSLCAEWWHIFAPVCYLGGKHCWSAPGWRLEDSSLRSWRFQEESSIDPVRWDVRETTRSPPKCRRLQPPTDLPTAFLKRVYLKNINEQCSSRYLRKTLSWWQEEAKRKRNSEAMETGQKAVENVKTELRYSDEGRCHMHRIRVVWCFWKSSRWEIASRYWGNKWMWQKFHIKIKSFRE